MKIIRRDVLSDPLIHCADRLAPVGSVIKKRRRCLAVADDSYDQCKVTSRVPSRCSSDPATDRPSCSDGRPRLVWLTQRDRWMVLGYRMVFCGMLCLFDVIWFGSAPPTIPKNALRRRRRIEKRELLHVALYVYVNVW